MSKIKAHVMDLHERLSESQIAERNARLKLSEINATVVKIQEMHHIDDEDLLIEIDKREIVIPDLKRLSALTPALT